MVSFRSSADLILQDPTILKGRWRFPCFGGFIESYKQGYEQDKCDGNDVAHYYPLPMNLHHQMRRGFWLFIETGAFLRKRVHASRDMPHKVTPICL